MTWRDAALILGPLLAFAAAMIANRQTARAAKVTQRAQDNATDVERERLGLDTLEKSLAEQENRINRLAGDVAAERLAREAAEKRALAARQRADEAQQRILRLTRRVEQLEQAMRDNDIPVPPALP